MLGHEEEWFDMTNVSLPTRDPAGEKWLLPEVLHGKNASDPTDFLSLDSLLAGANSAHSLIRLTDV